MSWQLNSIAPVIDYLERDQNELNHPTHVFNVGNYLGLETLGITPNFSTRVPWGGSLL